MALVYDDSLIQNHPIAKKYKSDLDVLCLRDYHKKFFHKPIICLDLDAYEKSISNQADATMDASVGIADYESNCKTKSRLLLIELRFDYKSTSNFDIQNMLQKVSHSRDLLKSNIVDKNSLFIYTPEVAQKAQHYFDRLSRQSNYRSICNWKAMNVNQFFDFIKNEGDFPYQPINDINQIKADLKNKYVSRGLDGLYDYTNFWLKRMQKYKVQNKSNECDAIAEVLFEFWNGVPNSTNSFENDIIFDMIENIKSYKK